MKRLAFFFLSFFLLLSPIRAQEVESLDSSSLKTDVIWQKERLDAEISTLKTTYQSQLENYLYQDKLYKIAYDQHQELQTLASIEDLTQKAKSLGVYRDEVLISYLNLLRLSLIATEGVELSLKNQSLTKLEEALDYIGAHQQNLQNVDDRDQVAASLAAFANDQKEINSLANEVLVLLSVGNLQAIYDKAIVLKGDINSYLTEKGTSDLPAIERASSETDRSLESAKLKLDTFWSDSIEHQTSKWYIAKFYSQLSRTLNPMYVNLSQSISYLSELLSI